LGGACHRHFAQRGSFFAMKDYAFKMGTSLLRPGVPALQQPPFWGRLVIMVTILLFPFVNIALIIRKRE
jgi:hypothetical protein